MNCAPLRVIRVYILLNGDFFLTSIWMYFYLTFYTLVITIIYALFFQCFMLTSNIKNNIYAWQFFSKFFDQFEYYRGFWFVQIITLAGIPPTSLFWIKILILQKILKFEFVNISLLYWKNPENLRKHWGNPERYWD